MHVQWLLAATFFFLHTNAQDCIPALGTTIRASECAVALNVLFSKLVVSGLSTPQRSSFASATRIFTHGQTADSLSKMPQGAQFESCAVAIDINPQVPAAAKWVDLLQRLHSLIAACPGGRGTLPPGRRHLGGTWVQGAFVFLVVDPGNGMRNIQGTCMSPRPPHTMTLLGIVTERVCGFQHLALHAPMPDRTQLPPAPNPLPLVVNFSGRRMVLPYRAKGQWVWNADVWSPLLINAFRVNRSVRSTWILVIGDSPNALFSRTVPRAMATAWVHVNNGVRRNLLGAWGSRASTWMPLSGDISYLGRLLPNWDWILLELEESAPLPTIGGSQRAPNATTTSSSCTTCLPSKTAEASASAAQTSGTADTADEEEAMAGLLELAGAVSYEDRTVPESSAVGNQAGSVQPDQGTSAGKSGEMLVPMQAVGGALDSGSMSSQAARLSGFMEPSLADLASFPTPLFAIGNSIRPEAPESSLDPGLYSLFQANRATPTPNAQPPPGWPSELGPLMRERPKDTNTQPSKRPRPNP